MKCQKKYIKNCQLVLKIILKILIRYKFLSETFLVVLHYNIVQTVQTKPDPTLLCTVKRMRDKRMVLSIIKQTQQPTVWSSLLHAKREVPVFHSTCTPSVHKPHRIEFNVHRRDHLWQPTSRFTQVAQALSKHRLFMSHRFKAVEP